MKKTSGKYRIMIKCSAWHLVVNIYSLNYEISDNIPVPWNQALIQSKSKYWIKLWFECWTAHLKNGILQQRMKSNFTPTVKTRPIKTLYLIFFFLLLKINNRFAWMCIYMHFSTVSICPFCSIDPHSWKSSRNYMSSLQ